MTMCDDLWNIRFTDEQDAYEIIAPKSQGGGVVDTVTARELVTVERPHELMRYRIEKAQGLHRVKRFVELLKEGKPA